MKTIVTLSLIILFNSSAKAQEVKGHLALDKNVSLEWVSEKFVVKGHKIETCKAESGDKFICKIDGKLWLGSDEGMENPRNQLKKLTIKINSDLINLDVSNMFNPSFDGGLSNKQFLFKKEGQYYRLYGFFSDGAGTYTVYWKILGDKSIREVISNDETYFSWQNDK